MMLNGVNDIKVDMGSGQVPEHDRAAHEMTPNRAIDALIHYFAANPDDAIALNDLGVLHSLMGHMAAALDCYRRAHRLDPQNMNIAKNLADLLFVEFGDLFAAMELYLSVLRQQPTDCDSLLAAGHISAAIDRFEDAEHFYTQVCQIEPGHPQATEALAHLDAAHETPPAIPETDAAGAYETLLSSVSADNAISSLSAFASRHPDFAAVFNDLGVLYTRSEDSDAAVSHYRQAVALDPYNATFLKNLGDHLLIVDGNFSESAKNYIEVLKMDPGDSEALYALATIAKSVGDEEGAADFVREIQQNDPNFLSALSSIQVQPQAGETNRSSLADPFNDQSMHRVTEATATTELEASLYVIAMKDLSLIEQRMNEFSAAGEHNRLFFLVSKEAIAADPQTAMFLKKSLGASNFIPTPSDALSATLADCLQADPSSYLAVIWDSVRVSAGWLAQMVAHFGNTETTAIVGPLSNFATGVQYTALDDSISAQRFDALSHDWLDAHRHQRIRVPNLNPHCVLLSRAVIEQIGTLDRDLPLLEAAIADWCLRARLAGFQAHIAGDTLAYMRTIGPIPKAKNELMTKKWNRILREEKLQHEALIELQRYDAAYKAYHQEGLAAALEVAMAETSIHELSVASLSLLVELCVDARQFEAADRFVPVLIEKANGGRHFALAGLVKEGLGDAHAADAFARQALQMDPQQPEALNLMGLLAYAQESLRF